MRTKEQHAISFDEIKKSFENRDYFIRSQFLESYHFKDNYRQYYVDYISAHAFSIKGESYLSDLVCFTVDQRITDKSIIDAWYLLLKQSTSTVVLVSILDFFNMCAIKELPSDYSKILLELSEKKRSIILRNQIYFNLISYDESNEQYQLLLINSLGKTKDSRSILRIISCLHLLNSKQIVSRIKERILSLKLDFLDQKMISYIHNSLSK